MVKCSCNIATLYLIMVISSCFYALSAPFLPPMYEEKHLKETWVGIVFAAFSISSMALSPHVGTLIEKYGQPRLILVANLIMALSISVFGFTKTIQDKKWVIIASLFLRFVQGEYFFFRHF